MIAAKVGNFKVVKVLLEYGADPTSVTNAGDTALSIGARVCRYLDS
jgi:ankyrin repeat protein